MSTGEALNDGQVAALRLAARRVHAAEALSDERGLEAVDRLVGLVAEIVVDAVVRVRAHEREAMLDALREALRDAGHPRLRVSDVA